MAQNAVGKAQAEMSRMQADLMEQMDKEYRAKKKTAAKKKPAAKKPAGKKK